MVNETVVAAPATAGGTLVVVEAEEGVEGVTDVEGADDALVVVRTLAAWCRALEQPVATITTATRTSPVVVLPVMNERSGRHSARSR
jgi:hypothetical protein